MLNNYKRKGVFTKRSLLKSEKIKPSILLVYEDVYSDQFHIKRSGKALMALCPIHPENNPSFALYEETNTGHCFSCGWSGDSYSLLMEKLNVNFIKAKYYAKRKGFFK